MQAADFLADAPGTLVPTIEAQLAFVPNALPPAIDMNEIGIGMGDAILAIGELRGACRRLQNPAILISPLQRREALTSSAMEGTFTTADNLALSEAGIERGADDSTREVRNYLRALNRSLAMLQELPICHRVIKAAHDVLLSGLGPGRGAQKRPGDYKIEQNWIGGRSIERARFIPPPPVETLAGMDELERYINRDDRRYPTALMDLALVHYQIETIHPFADGNGRVGRMLVSIMAVKSGLLDLPVLYISPALETEKDRYIDLMFNVSARGEWVPWLDFFFERIETTCRDTVATIDRLIALQGDYRAAIGGAIRSASALTLVDTLFDHPVITIGIAQERLGITYPAAKKVVDRLVDHRILVEIPDIYPKTFIAPEVLSAAQPKDQADPDRHRDRTGDSHAPRSSGQGGA